MFSHDRGFFYIFPFFSSPSQLRARGREVNVHSLIMFCCFLSLRPFPWSQLFANVLLISRPQAGSLDRQRSCRVRSRLSGCFLMLTEPARLTKARPELSYDRLRTAGFPCSRRLSRAYSDNRDRGSEHYVGMSSQVGSRHRTGCRRTFEPYLTPVTFARTFLCASGLGCCSSCLYSEHPLFKLLFKLPLQRTQASTANTRLLKLETQACSLLHNLNLWRNSLADSASESRNRAVRDRPRGRIHATPTTFSVFRTMPSASNGNQMKMRGKATYDSSQMSSFFCVCLMF